ncbi:serine acetyltransferase [Aliivibrio sp. S4TY2]|uniref:serine O-acetyltransferase n=1 Tax=Aliivibrio TaxID=511678 RepID=UPI0010201E88|nr:MULTISPECIES: serine acetyltransferase [Aliivibrio]MDD9156052.1 serine acetyltransferase [Aliivibrio sp. S4TY2]MDD9159761.1 serine acetyltransferase [Aliivibrio sp. S4TY1]MDD9163760.1 serine acetyltransferase [Aliivibrio sp. S4MY2]MDD9167761.1 serine acetyltransferase [Aliivibrio sp. S4MY4]MDD9185575.1 serine acetyltransferase [Aliivibrio sp. S4MY3]
MLLQRIGHFFYRSRIPILPKLCNALIRFIHNSAVFSESKIGKGTTFAYGGIGVVIHKRSVIGEHCIIGSNVTLGGKSQSQGVPTIGNGCFIATGAKILGDVRIGNNCVIGANAVVVSDIPNNCMAAGVPAQIIKRDIEPKDYY